MSSSLALARMVNPVSPTVAGLTQARRSTRLGSRSFWFASFALDAPRRDAAYALYAFLRAADDAADMPGAKDLRLARIARQRDQLDRVYCGAPVSPLDHAFAWAVERYSIPRGPIDALLRTVELDVGRVRIPTWRALEDYCYGVASTVGLAMSPLLGAPDDAQGYAVALGRAMQLTNILRDVCEDLEADRVYLPADLLAAAELNEIDLRSGVRDERWLRVAREIASRAHADYDAAERGIVAIPSRRSRTTVRLMRAVYREILCGIERRDFDVFSGRVVIGTPKKIWLATRVALGLDPARRSLP